MAASCAKMIFFVCVRLVFVSLDAGVRRYRVVFVVPDGLWPSWGSDGLAK